MARLRKTFIAAALGAAGAYFFDPQQGARRRNEARDKLLSKARGGARDAAQKASYAEGVARGAVHPGDETQPGELDDVTLARKVETEIFRDADAPKDRVSVNAEDGVVYLRGEVDPDQARQLAEAARQVAGVRGIKNLLHGPGEEAPAKEDAEVESPS